VFDPRPYSASKTRVNALLSALKTRVNALIGTNSHSAPDKLQMRQ